MIQDIIDGETDGSGEINVLGDATFTAAHPCIPSGRYNLWSTNNASIGWANGVTLGERRDAAGCPGYNRQVQEHPLP